MSDIRIQTIPAPGSPTPRQFGRGVRVRTDTGCKDAGQLSVNGIGTVRKGSVAELFLRLTCRSGTLTVTTQYPACAPAVSLYDASGAPLTAWAGKAASYYDTDAQGQIEANYLLDTNDPALVEGSRVTLEWTLWAACSGDGSTRKFVVPLAIDIVPRTL